MYLNLNNKIICFTEDTVSNVRRPIPVSTIDWQSTTASQFIPMHGLDFLTGVDRLYIQQTVELNERT